MTYKYLIGVRFVRRWIKFEIGLYVETDQPMPGWFNRLLAIR